MLGLTYGMVDRFHGRQMVGLTYGRVDRWEG